VAVKISAPFGFLRRVFGEFGEDGAVTLAASLAYYTALSMAPLVLLVLRVAALFGPQGQQDLVDQITALIGSQGGDAVQLVILSSKSEPVAGNVAGILSVLMLIFGASAVFSDLQHALNTIWDVRSRPKSGLWGWIRKRLLSMGILLAVLFLLLVSTVISAVLALGPRATADLPGGAALWSVVHLVFSVAVFTALFALMFRYLPDVRIQWRDVWLGAFATAVLFALGKFAVGFYLGRSSVGSAYGAAGSLVILLVWAYYSALVFFLGAEWTQVWARAHGRGIQPNRFADPLEEPREGAPAKGRGPRLAGAGGSEA
jgi:membrane protein